jgi:hypothetical protein
MEPDRESLSYRAAYACGRAMVWIGIPKPIQAIIAAPFIAALFLVVLVADTARKLVILVANTATRSIRFLARTLAPWP